MWRVFALYDAAMCALPLCIIKKGGKFFARFQVNKKKHSGPCRSTVVAASADLLRLRSEHPSLVVRQLPRYVSRHCGFRKGYRAKRSIGIVCKVGPLRATISEAKADATLLAQATSVELLEQIKFVEED